MGINSVGLHQNQTRSRVNPSQVCLNPGQVGQLRWGGVSWLGAGPSRAVNWAKHRKTKGGQAGPSPNERGISAHRHRGNRIPLFNFKSLQDLQTKYDLNQI
jgi:hypothetical protein